MKTLLVLFLGILPLAAQPQVQVRVVSIEKPGASTSLEAAQPDCDEKLYNLLTAGVAEGSAKIVHDQTILVRSGGRSKTESRREWPEVLRSAVRPGEWFHYPMVFDFKNLGQRLDVAATISEEPHPAVGRRLLDLSVGSEDSALLGMHPWPVPDVSGAGQTGRVLRPVTSMHSLHTWLFTWTGRTVLLSVAASPGALVQESAEIPFRYTFLRAGLEGEKPAPANARPEDLPVRQHRVHALSFRLSRNEAAALMLLHARDDAALYGQLRSRVQDGTVTLSEHAALLCRNGGGSRVESETIFQTPERSTEMIPCEWQGHIVGRRLEVGRPEGSWWLEAGPGGHGDYHFFSTDAPELVPSLPSVPQPVLHGAAGAACEFVERNWLTDGTIPPSGIMCGGVLSTSPAIGEDDVPAEFSDVNFLLQFPPPGPSGATPPPQTLMHCAVLSVPAEEGPALAAAVTSLETSAPAAALIARLNTGELHCAAHAAAVIRIGQRNKIACVRKVVGYAWYKQSSAVPNLQVPSGYNLHSCGLSVDAEITGEGKDLAVNLALEWDTAPLLPFGAPGEISPDGGANPENPKRRCVQNIQLQDLKLTRGQPVIADVRASNARAGTPEHGRWHALVLLAR